MSIEIKITGTHATDIAAQIETLAQMFGIGTGNVVGANSGVTGSTTSAQSTSQQATSTETQSVSGKTDEKKTLSRKEQDEATAEMIKNGAKDARFDLLTKGRQNEVEASLIKPAAAATSDVDSMFDDAPAARVVTRDMVSKLMGDVCKKPDGSAIQARALKVREILVDRIPEGKEVKVANISEDKLIEAYDLIANVAKIIPAE